MLTISLNHIYLKKSSSTSSKAIFLLLLTHDKENMSYDEYCKRIKDSVNTPAGKLAWFVKIADMKDHLNKTDTLTDKLKEKYLSGLRYLL